MNFSFFIAGKLALGNRKGFSRMIIRIGIAAVAISLAVMICSVAIVTGFQKEITNKVSGFGSHIRVSKLDFNNSFEGSPISRSQPFMATLRHHPGIARVQSYATKAGIIKTENDIEGIVLKGVDESYDRDFLASQLKEGRLPAFGDSVVPNEILISGNLAKKLKVKPGDKLSIYFIQEPVRARSLVITGIYETGLEDYDKTFAVVDIRHIQRLNGWNDSLIQGLEIRIHDFSRLDEITGEVNDLIGMELRAMSIRELKPQIFDWLGLLDSNVAVILTLMALVACINMITALLILIIERTNMIGILKALGAGNGAIRNIFLVKAAYLILQGMFFGNLVALALCFYQEKSRFMKLDAESYYVSYVPVNLELAPVLLINAVTFLLCLCALLLPAMAVLRISPVKAIRFD